MLTIVHIAVKFNFLCYMSGLAWHWLSKDVEKPDNLTRQHKKYRDDNKRLMFTWELLEIDCFTDINKREGPGEAL